jgi:hypothetical protein
VRRFVLRPTWAAASIASFISLASLGLATGASAAAADASIARALAPDAVYVQAGLGRSTQTSVAGATWSWRWRRDFAGGLLGGCWEASFGRWSTEQGEGDASAWITQVGLTPVLRWHTGTAPDAWFVEGGIGGNVILPLYRSRDKRFSTAFNFGDHLAVGRRFGDEYRHEWALRLQHFSNAGIKRPNPGADFVQLRYTRLL